MADRDSSRADPIRLCVCVPARNEAERLPILLEALANQDWPGLIPVAVVVNNSVDDSLGVLATASVRYEHRLGLRIICKDFVPDLAHAGSARRLAMDEGCRLLSGSASALVSTDADSRPPPDWLSAIAAALDAGADVVGGRILIDQAEPLPPDVARLRAAWDAYWEHVRGIEDAIDPLPWDPAPRHGDHTGASLAIRTALYRASGGVPLLPSGEDRGLVAAALAKGGRLSHPASVYTHVSSRRDGRASDGMAASMDMLFDTARRGSAPMAPHFDHWRERAAWRRKLRAREDGAALIARQEPLLPPMPNDMPLCGLLELAA